MQIRTRKLVGTLLLLGFLALYSALVVAVAAGRIATAPPLAQFGFFLVAGLVWVVPAGFLIRWMTRPAQT